MAITAVLFDLTGVLTTSPWPHLTAAAGGNVELLVGAYHEDSDHPWHRLERGEIGFAEWFQDVSALAAAVGVEFDLAPMAALRDEMVVYPHVIERVLELRRDSYKTALVTNNVREGSTMWRSLMPVDELFDVVIDSSEVGVRKPNRAIFDLALQQLGVTDPGSAVFLDDLASNVVAARAIGLHGIVVGDPPDGALDELDALLAAHPRGDGSDAHRFWQYAQMAEPKAVVEELLRRQEARDDSVLDDLVAEDMVNHAAGLQGREGLRQILDVIRHDLGDGEVEQHHLIADGELVAQHLTVRGVHQGSTMPLLAGTDPSGQEVSWTFIHIWRVVDGQIVEHWACRDDLGLLHQIGAWPPGAAP